MQAETLTALTVQSTKIRYRYRTAADLAVLYDKAMLDQQKIVTLYTGSSLRSCVLQRMRDHGTASAQAASIACTATSPLLLQAGNISLVMPASAGMPGEQRTHARSAGQVAAALLRAMANSMRSPVWHACGHECLPKMLLACRQSTLATLRLFVEFKLARVLQVQPARQLCLHTCRRRRLS